MRRIVNAKSATLTVERLPLSALKPHPANPRRHPEPGTPAWAVLRKSIEHDYFDPMIWNKRNGLLVSGHLRRKVLEASGFTEADCVVVDYDEPMHLARMAAANKQQGEDDVALLKDLIVELDTGAFDLDLTGFDAMELERVINWYPPMGENDPDAEWQGMPEFQNVDMTSAFRAIVHFETLEARTEFEKLMGQKIPANTKAIWFPAKKWENMRADAYIGES